MVFLSLHCADCGTVTELELAAGECLGGAICLNEQCRSRKMILDEFQHTGNRVVARILFDLEKRVMKLEEALGGKKARALQS
jgi:hypothetical protein